VFALTAAQRDALALLATFRAAWPNIRRRVRVALHGAGLVNSVVRPTLTPAGEHAAQLSRCLITNGASLAQEQRSEKAPLPHVEENCVRLAHVVAKASPQSAPDTPQPVARSGAA
jgi:hypothetical protein